MQPETSLKAVEEFWTWGKEKGYVRPGSAADVLSALRAVTEELEPDEKENLLNLDPAELIRRFLNRKGRKLGLATQREYRLRFLRALEAYREFQANPGKWPSLRRRKDAAATEVKKAPNHRAAKERSDEQKLDDPAALTDTPISMTGGLTYPFPLRPGLTVVIQRLPSDLKLAEAERLAAFLRSLAEDYHA
jgi:hypothetical protein